MSTHTCHEYTQFDLSEFVWCALSTNGEWNYSFCEGQTSKRRRIGLPPTCRVPSVELMSFSGEASKTRRRDRASWCAPADGEERGCVSAPPMHELELERRVKLALLHCVMSQWSGCVCDCVCVWTWQDKEKKVKQLWTKTLLQYWKSEEIQNGLYLFTALSSPEDCKALHTTLWHSLSD